jgi:hypothetical protein
VKFTIVAVTKLGKGICVAGIKESQNGYEWIRPTRLTGNDWRGLDYKDRYDRSTKVGALVDWELNGRLDDAGPHVEDYLHPRNGKKKLIRGLNHEGFLDFIAQFEETEAADFKKFVRNKISLNIVKPDEISKIQMDNYSVRKKFQPRITFKCQDGTYDYSVTDLSWLNFTNKCNEESKFSTGSYSAFTRKFKLKIEYLILGAGHQLWNKKYWQFIIGVVCNKPLPE